MQIFKLKFTNRIKKQKQYLHLHLHLHIHTMYRQNGIKIVNKI